MIPDLGSDFDHANFSSCCMLLLCLTNTVRLYITILQAHGEIKLKDAFNNSNEESV